MNSGNFKNKPVFYKSNVHYTAFINMKITMARGRVGNVGSYIQTGQFTLVILAKEFRHGIRANRIAPGTNGGD